MEDKDDWTQWVAQLIPVWMILCFIPPLTCVGLPLFIFGIVRVIGNGFESSSSD
jgi:hypothetical protein